MWPSCHGGAQAATPVVDTMPRTEHHISQAAIVLSETSSDLDPCARICAFLPHPLSRSEHGPSPPGNLEPNREGEEVALLDSDRVRNHCWNARCSTWPPASRTSRKSSLRRSSHTVSRGLSVPFSALAEDSAQATFAASESHKSFRIINRERWWAHRVAASASSSRNFVYLV